MSNQCSGTDNTTSLEKVAVAVRGERSVLFLTLGYYSLPLEVRLKFKENEAFMRRLSAQIQFGEVLKLIL